MDYAKVSLYITGTLIEQLVCDIIALICCIKQDSLIKNGGLMFIFNSQFSIINPIPAKSFKTNPSV